MSDPGAASTDPREQSVGTGQPQTIDPESGVSDDPRVDPTPEKRQSDTDAATRES